jgi:hypothetical protein
LRDFLFRSGSRGLFGRSGGFPPRTPSPARAGSWALEEGGLRAIPSLIHDTGLGSRSRLGDSFRLRQPLLGFHRLRLLFAPRLVRLLVLLIIVTALLASLPALIAAVLPARPEIAAIAVAALMILRAPLLIVAVAVLIVAALRPLIEAFRLLAAFGRKRWALADIRLALIALSSRFHLILIAEFIFGSAILLLHLLLIGLCGDKDAQIMFGVLEVAFGHHDIAGDLGVTTELKIFVGDGLRRPAHFHIGSVALIDAIERIATATASAPTTAIVTTIAAAAALVVLTWSHFFLMP